MREDIRWKIEASLKQALTILFKQSPQEKLPLYLEIPKNKEFGDLSSNIAMRLAPLCKKPPLEIANLIVDFLKKDNGLKDSVREIQVEPPAFINFFFTAQYLHKSIEEILTVKDKFGSSDIGKNKKVQIEFVSANPTGPLSVAHARQAAVGDALANILNFLGFEAKREYYINDEGNQIRLLGASVMMRAWEQITGFSIPDMVLGVSKDEFEENGYQGDYIKDVAAEFIDKSNIKNEIDLKKHEDKVTEYSVDYLIKVIKKELDDFSVRFDIWSSQKKIASPDAVKKALEILEKKGFIYKEEGAVWFESTKLGDDKNRVLVKSDSSFTYLAPDIAYHLNKYKRGFNWLINIWGPDHHGYILRLKAAVQALGEPLESLSVIIVQLATLQREGKPVPMSTRKGQYITLREIIEEVGVDVARFFFLMRRTSSHLIFDLDLAKKQSLENPVYYIQYAHARITGIINKSEGLSADLKKSDLTLLKEPEEIDLIKILVRFPLSLEVCLRLIDPYTLTDYLQELATAFHKFYDKHKVISEDEDLSKARMVLITAVKIVLANGLRLLGVSAPEKM